ncbi:MAG: hypothetical protein U0787_09985 [Polyangia bacterium]
MGAKTRMSLVELREMSKLCKKHWGDGSIRSLLIGRGGYRPTLMVRVEERHKRTLHLHELRDLKRDCAERARLADLYDKAQSARGDARRAERA